MRTVGFDVGGKRHELKATNASLRAIEDRTKRGFGEVLADLQQSGSVTVLTEIFRALHVGAISIEAADEIIDEIGLVRTGELVGEALAEAMPQDAVGGNSPAAGEPPPA